MGQLSRHRRVMEQTLEIHTRSLPGASSLALATSSTSAQHRDMSMATDPLSVAGTYAAFIRLLFA